MIKRYLHGFPEQVTVADVPALVERLAVIARDHEQRVVETPLPPEVLPQPVELVVGDAMAASYSVLKS